tara:strand:+ start:17018 stop:17752 length:735 start_codon:yes stop_codon:yes gene_type:complete
MRVDARGTRTPTTGAQLHCPSGVFEPTGTTELLIESILGFFSAGQSTLDLGCGCGIVGISLANHGIADEPVCFSDVSDLAVITTQGNCNRYGVTSDCRVGSTLDPWKGQRFDLVVSDVSGISTEVAAASSWFENVPCDTGLDGSELVLEVVERSCDHLTSSGSLVIPVLSLSNAERILRALEEKFDNVQEIGRKDWVFPPELKSQLPMMQRLKDLGAVSWEHRFGTQIWTTTIVCARTPANGGR